MKLMKFTPALMAAFVLSACSTASDVVSSTVDTMGKATDAVTEGVSQAATSVKDGVSNAVKTVTDKLDSTTKSVVYLCQNNTLVTATYGFEGQQAKSIQLTLGKQVIKGLTLNEKAPNPGTFESQAYRWNTGDGFSLANFDKVTSVMLTQLGKSTDQILAKNCSVDAALTAKLNK